MLVFVWPVAQTLSGAFCNIASKQNAAAMAKTRKTSNNFKVILLLVLYTIISKKSRGSKYFPSVDFIPTSDIIPQKTQTSAYCFMEKK